MNLCIHPVETAESSMSDCALTTLTTEILPRNYKSSSGTGANSSGGRFSSRYICYASELQTLLTPLTAARIEEIRGRVGIESWTDKPQTRRLSPASRRLQLADSLHSQEEDLRPHRRTCATNSTHITVRRPKSTTRNSSRSMTRI